MNENMQKHITRELIDNFKAFYASLYQHKLCEEIEEDQQKYLDDIMELMAISDDVELKVKFICDTVDTKAINTRYQQIQDFVKNGVDLAENVLRFTVVIRASFRKNGVEYHSADNTPFFKSESFVIREADKRYTMICEDAIKKGTSKSIIVSKEDLQEFSNERIRFCQEKSLEA